MTGTGDVMIAVPAALAAAAAFGLAAAVQHRQAQQIQTQQIQAQQIQAQQAGPGQAARAPRADRTRRAGRTRSAPLLARLARQPMWLAGIGLAVLGYGLQAAALAFGPLTLVAPIVAIDLMFALPVAARWAGRRLTARDWAGCALTAGGIAAFLITAPEASGRSDAPARYWLLAFGAVALACVLVRAIGRRLGPAARAASTAAAAGLIYGLTAAVTLSLTRLVRAGGLWPALGHWQPWALAGLGLSGLALTMGAFQAGTLGASLPVIDTVEPVAGVLIGTLVFGEHLAASAAGLGVQAAGAAAAVTGIVLLGSAPRAAGHPGTGGRRPAGESRMNRQGGKKPAAGGTLAMTAAARTAASRTAAGRTAAARTAASRTAAARVAAGRDWAGDRDRAGQPDGMRS